MTKANNTLSVQDAPTKTTHEDDLSAAKGIVSGVLLGAILWILFGIAVVVSS